MKGFIYNAGGLSIPLEFTPGVPFRFECSEEECGKRVVIEGVIVEVSSSEFTEVLERVVRENPDFRRILEINARRFIFRGKVNGKDETLPVESLDDFAERFLDEVLVLKP
ncbi:hypothetical protein [Thermococcus sp.]|uniref:hypothetical protein n=1 Tax=Thermococcus sp. TaxID=35749 RepID=UPI0026091EF1|nr:hypothetical protein [Thermococcus sp.]